MFSNYSLFSLIVWGFKCSPLPILKEVNYAKNLRIKFPKDMPARISIIVKRGVS